MIMLLNSFQTVRNLSFGGEEVEKQTRERKKNNKKIKRIGLKFELCSFLVISVKRIMSRPWADTFVQIRGFIF